jgi:hypothetical protein
VKPVSSPWRFASILGLVTSCSACEFESYLDGVVRSPAEKCGAADEELLPGANVQLTCPAGSPARVTGADRQVLSNEKGEFEVTVVGLDALGICRVRVQRDGYKPLDASLSELGLRRDPTLHGRLFVTLRLQRSSAAP